MNSRFITVLSVVIFFSSCSTSQFTFEKRSKIPRISKRFNQPKEQKKSKEEISYVEIVNKTASIGNQNPILDLEQKEYRSAENNLPQINDSETRKIKHFALRKIAKKIKSDKPKNSEIISYTKDSNKNENKTHWSSIVSFSSSILGLLTLPFFFGLCAVIFGAIGLSKKEYKGKGLAIAGFILGILEVLVIFVVLALILAVL